MRFTNAIAPRKSANLKLRSMALPECFQPGRSLRAVWISGSVSGMGHCIEEEAGGRTQKKALHSCVGGALGISEAEELRADFAAQVGPKGIGHGDEDVYDLGIKLGAAKLHDLDACGGEGLRRAIRAIRRDGVERICDREDACSQGNLFAF